MDHVDVGTQVKSDTYTYIHTQTHAPSLHAFCTVVSLFSQTYERSKPIVARDYSVIPEISVTAHTIQSRPLTKPAWLFSPLYFKKYSSESEDGRNSLAQEFRGIAVAVSVAVVDACRGAGGVGGCTPTIASECDLDSGCGRE